MDLTQSDVIGIALALFAMFATFVHLVSTVLAAKRVTRPAVSAGQDLAEVEVTVIRPVCGLEAIELETLKSTFLLEHSRLDVLFCASSESDAAVPYVRSLIAAYPHVRARLLIGDERPTQNPKLNNLLKGWRAAEAPWIIMADSNVLMSPTYIPEMLSAWNEGMGLVCSPPVGAAPSGFWGEVECAFLNSYQVRWQLSADSAGFAFAQGKSMLWRRADLEAAGGLLALGAEIAEDAAATKIVRRAGLNVRLVDRPFKQLIGLKSRRQVWDRQVRWARLRRATFLPYYLLECMAGSFLPSIAAAGAALYADVDPVLVVALLQVIWFSAEAALTRIAGWHMSWMSPFAWALRDLALPWLWVAGFNGNTFTWRGNEMSVRAEPQRLAGTS